MSVDVRGGGTYKMSPDKQKETKKERIEKELYETESKRMNN